jgi:CCL2 lectin-like
MADNIVTPSSYYIINRVLSPSGVKLAVQYNGLDKKLTLSPLDETNRNQRVSGILRYAIAPASLTYVSFHCSGC